MPSDLLAGFEAFCQRVTVPATKEYGAHLLWPLFATQEYFLSEVRAGLEAGIHEFIVLKGRQQGLTTICDALDLWYLQTHAGMLGMIVLDDIDNQNFRRLMLRGMLASLPRALRFPVGEDNRSQLVWRESSDGPMRSILLYANAGKREDSNNNLGRSKGVNYLHGDEVGAWLNDKAVSAVQDSLAERHPERLYIWGSTAQGFGPFRDMWLTAQEAATQRAIFIGWWRHALYRIEQGTATWELYAGAPSKEEREWMREVKRRYGVTIQPEQLVWYRYRLAEKYRGDETMRMQEHPCVPTDAFVAFGEKFIPYGVIKGLRDRLDAVRKPDGFRYEFGKFLDTTKAVACSLTDASLKVWEEPQPYAVYIVAAHPWGSSSVNATEAVCQVWRAWPDRTALVAEYWTEDPDMYRLAWVCLHLLSAYISFRTSHSYNPVYFVYEIGWGGERVMRTIDAIRDKGRHLSTEVVGRDLFLNMTGCIEYFYRRIDTFGSTVARQSKTTGEERARKLFALRDELTQEHLEIPHAALVDELSMLRLAEHGDADEIGGGAHSPESRAITATMAVVCRLDQDVDTAVRTHIAPKQSIERETHVGEVLVGNALGRLIRTGRM